MKFAPLLVLLGCLAGSAQADPTLALGAGEALMYHVSWVVIPGAGRINIAAQPAVDAAGHRQMRIVSTTETRGLARLILPFDARSESLYNAADGRLIWLGETSDTRSRHQAHTVVFDYAKRTADYTNPPEALRALPMPAGDPTDLITCLLAARTWNLKPGQKRDALVLFNDDFYQLTIHAVRYEEVETSFGTFATLLLEPRMEETPPKGMFKRGSTVRGWVAQDARRLPVQFEVQFNFGSGLATLARYTPPAKAAASK
jgi:hypothetical protein